MDDYKFVENVKQLMESRGFNSKRLAEELGVTPAAISRYISGVRRPELTSVIKISQYFNVSTDWLLGINGDKFDIMPKEVQEIATLYQRATEDDRAVVQAVLKKYKEK